MVMKIKKLKKKNRVESFSKCNHSFFHYLSLLTEDPPHAVVPP
jgi:hypothetical protein